MAQEIEKKFLVTSDEYKTVASKRIRITQGYLCSVPERTVRIRIKDKSGYITVKGIGNHSGTSRFEWEKEIPVSDADELLRICEPGVIDKIRYEVMVGGHKYEVDEFFGENRGLTVAEIEMKDELELFLKPAWIGREVTGDPKYYNSMLMKHPFTKW